MDNKITICNFCKNKNQPCASVNKASTWKDLLDKQECLDYELKDEFKLENLSFKTHQ